MILPRHHLAGVGCTMCSRPLRPRRSRKPVFAYSMRMASARVSSGSIQRSQQVGCGSTIIASCCAFLISRFTVHNQFTSQVTASVSRYPPPAPPVQLPNPVISPPDETLSAPDK